MSPPRARTREQDELRRTRELLAALEQLPEAPVADEEAFAMQLVEDLERQVALDSLFDALLEMAVTGEEISDDLRYGRGDR